MSSQALPSVWSLAGHDPFGGAGIQADIRAALSYGVPLRTLITTHTAQNDERLHQVEAYPQGWLEGQWQSLVEGERPAAVKIGLIADEASLKFLADRLDGMTVILDPVLASSSGSAFQSPSFLDAFKTKLLPKVQLITPNHPETEALVGFRLATTDDLKRAARRLREMGAKAVLIKGGHANGDELLDYFDDGERPYFLRAKRLGGNYRGTGCSLSTAIACGLAQGLPLRDAVVLGHSFVQALIKDAHRDGRNHLGLFLGTPELSALSYEEEAPRTHFAAMPRSIGFYTVAPDAIWVERLAKARVPTLQLRAKTLEGDALEEAISKAKAACAAADSLLFLNDDWRRGIRHQVFGVHLGQEDLDSMSSEDLDELAASGLRLGISTHSLEEAARAKALRPSYIALGPVFETTCKSMRFGPQGIARVGTWVRGLAGVPLVAIGGLKREHAEAVLAEGADGIAVISDVTQAQDPESRVNEWRKAFSV